MISSAPLSKAAFGFALLAYFGLNACSRKRPDSPKVTVPVLTPTAARATSCLDVSEGKSLDELELRFTHLYLPNANEPTLADRYTIVINQATCEVVSRLTPPPYRAPRRPCLGPHRDVHARAWQLVKESGLLTAEIHAAAQSPSPHEPHDYVDIRQGTCRAHVDAATLGDADRLKLFEIQKAVATLAEQSAPQ